LPFPDLSARSLAELTSLQGKRAVVTGGARGLGLAIARRLVEAGADVLLGDLDEAAAKAAADDLASAFAATVEAMGIDVAEAGSVAALASQAVATLGGIDVWVNNAGIYPSRPLMQMTDDDWDRVLDINLRGTFIGCREAARRMVAAGQGGVIVNVASVAGLGGRGAGVSAYVASKHGIVGLTKQLALELVGEGIRVLAVAPTIILTPGVETAMGARALAEDATVAKLIAGPTGRAGLPDDVARVVLFCASDLAGFMTGATLPVDGGETAR
jgi:NAD(P)-dependent dehydrogenase (short-subunit alcohol dehydrogenase family)